MTIKRMALRIAISTMPNSKTSKPNLVPSKLSLTPRSWAALVAVIVCLAGAGYLGAKQLSGFAATAPTEIICSHGTANGVVCLNRYRGETGANVAVVGYWNSYDLNERFQFQSLPGLCGGHCFVDVFHDLEVVKEYRQGGSHRQTLGVKKRIFKQFELQYRKCLSLPQTIGRAQSVRAWCNPGIREYWCRWW